MKKEDYFIYTGAVFLVVGLLHGARVFYDWGLLLGAWEVPMWFSGVAAVVALFFAYNAYKLK